MPAKPFEERFFAPPPPATNAQEAATRVYNRNGILVRSDPHIQAADRFGRPFKPTQWYEPPTGEGTAVPARATRNLQQEHRVPEDPLAHFRKKVIQRGGAAGIHSLARVFRTMDDDGNRKVNAEELHSCLQDFGIFSSPDDVRGLISSITGGRSPVIRFDDFLLAIRGDINPRRQRLIDMAFRVLDRTGDGSVTLEDIQACYNADHDPDVLAGRSSSDEALRSFLSVFDGNDQNGIVTRKEFTDYYRNVSASVDDDDYFELMLRNAWHISGGSGACANTANHRLLVVFEDGAQKVVELRHDLGVDPSDHAAVQEALEAQGVRNIARFTFSGDV